MMSRLALALAVLLAPAAATAEVFRSEALSLPEVDLVDQAGAVHRLADVGGKDGLMVITFAYTTCDSICPIGNAVMAEVDEALGPDSPARLVTITIDPSRDTPAAMRRAAREIGASDNWLWLTGEPAGVTRLLEALQARPEDLMLHDPLFLVGDPASGRLYRSQSLPEAGELLSLIEAWQS